MPRFDYIALDAQGQEISGSVEAIDVIAARSDLRQKALVPLSLELEGKGVRPKSRGAGGRRFSPAAFLSVKDRDKQFLFRQLALLIKSGHRLRGALELIETITIKNGMRRAIRRMIQALDQGDSFADAIRAEKKLFPGNISALVEAGERSGTLAQILNEIAANMERAQEMRNALRRALISPIITMVVAVLLLIGIVVFLVPRISDFLARTGGELHWSMGTLVSLHEFFYYNWRELLIVIGGAIFLIAAMTTFPKGKLILDRIWLGIPILGRTAVLYEMARLGNIGSLLIRSGLRQVEMLRILGQVTPNAAIQDRYERSAMQLLEGQKMSDALDSPVIDKLARHMIGVGESSGNLDDVLDQIGTYFTSEVETRIRVLFAAMVGSVTIIVGVIVAIIYLSVFLTILGALNSIR